MIFPCGFTTTEYPELLERTNVVLYSMALYEAITKC